MRDLRAACLIALLSLTNLPARAYTGSWDDVRNLSRGIPLVVRAEGRFYCTLVDVTDSALLCEPENSHPWRRNTAAMLTLRKDSIREVRLDGNRRDTVDHGFLIGAGTGLAVTGIAAATNKDAAIMLFAPLPMLVFGGIGGLVGHCAPMRGGRPIYRR